MDSWWLGASTGFVLTLCAVTLAIKVRLRRRRAQFVIALTVGLALLIGSVAALALDSPQCTSERPTVNRRLYEVPVAPGLPRTPDLMVLALVTLAAQHDTTRACSLFSPDAATAFAVTHSSADCPGAIERIAGQVLAYQDDILIPAGALINIDANTKIIDACHLVWKAGLELGPDLMPGPQLGMLTLQEQAENGYRITGYLACSRQ